MNFYGLPEFLSYSFLVGIAVVLIRQDPRAHLRYWLVGWIIVLLHAVVFMLLVPGFEENVLGRALLAAAGLAFLLAAYYQKSPPDNREFSLLLLRVGLPNLLFAVASTAYIEINQQGADLMPFAVLTVLGLACATWQAFDATEPRIHPRVLVALSCLAYGIQAWCLYAYGVTMASQWLMCWTYLAVGFFFIYQAGTVSLGIVFTALSFVLWGLVFPVYSLLQIYAPEVSAHIESMVWNLPKFLTASGMVLMLLEERAVRAVKLATHDELTGLPNRRLYEDRFNFALNRAHRNNSQFAVLVMDLNRFKQVNDTLGHQVGDELLKIVSGRFRSVLRNTDMVARTGGDEFSVILESVNSIAGAAHVIDNIKNAMNLPIVVTDITIDFGVSIGAALYPNDGTTQTELHSIADKRMYADKAFGRSTA